MSTKQNKLNGFLTGTWKILVYQGIIVFLLFPIDRQLFLVYPVFSKSSSNCKGVIKIGL